MLWKTDGSPEINQPVLSPERVRYEGLTPRIFGCAGGKANFFSLGKTLLLNEFLKERQTMRMPSEFLTIKLYSQRDVGKEVRNYPY